MSLSPSRHFQRTKTQMCLNKDVKTGELTPQSKKVKNFKDAINILRKCPYSRTEADIEFLGIALESNVQALKKIIAQKTEEDLIGKLLREFTCRYVKEGDTIITINDIGEEMYILLTGHVEVLTKDPEPLYIPFENEAAVLDYKEEDVTIFLQATPTNTIIPAKTNEETHEIIPAMTVYEVLLLKSVFNTDKPGFIFGQDALLQGKPRNATILALEDCYLATLKKPQFDQLIRKEMEKHVIEKIKFMKQFTPFQLQRRFLEKYNQFLKDATYNKGDIIYREFDYANTLYFIEKGQFSIEKTIYRQSKIHGKVELYTIVDPDKSEKLSITIEDQTAAKKQILDYYDGDGYAHQQNKIKSVLHIYLLGDNSMFGIEDSLCNFRKRIFTVRCMSESAKLWHISKNEYRKYFYRNQPIAKDIDECARQRLGFLLSRIQDSLATKAEMINFIGRKGSPIVEKSYEVDENNPPKVKGSTFSQRPPSEPNPIMQSKVQVSNTGRILQTPNLSEIDTKTWDITQSVPTNTQPPPRPISTTERAPKSLLSNTMDTTRLKERLRPLSHQLSPTSITPQPPRKPPKTAIGATRPKIAQNEGIGIGITHGAATYHKRSVTEGNLGFGGLGDNININIPLVLGQSSSLLQLPTASQLSTFDKGHANPFTFKYRRILKNMKKSDDFYISAMQQEMFSATKIPITPITPESPPINIKLTGEPTSTNPTKNTPKPQNTATAENIYIQRNSKYHTHTLSYPSLSSIEVGGGQGGDNQGERGINISLKEAGEGGNMNMDMNMGHRKCVSMRGVGEGKLQHLKLYSIRSGNGHLLSECSEVLGGEKGRGNVMTSEGKRQKGRLLRSTKHNMFRMISYPKYSLNTNNLIQLWNTLAKDIQIRKMKNNPYTLKEILNILDQLLFGIKYLHNNQIAHNNLTPVNIFLTKDFNLKIGDFGIATFLSIGDYKLMKAGSASYASPEYVNEGECKFESDIWVIGCIIFELITLEKAFTGTNRGDLMENIRRGEWREDLLQGAKNCSPGLANLVAKIFTVDKKKRPTISQILVGAVVLADPPELQKANIIPKMKEEKKVKGVEETKEITKKHTTKCPEPIPTAEKIAKTVENIEVIQVEAKPNEETKEEIVDQSPKPSHLAAKLRNGEILIFDSELNILNKFKSSLKVFSSNSNLAFHNNNLIISGKEGIEYWNIISPTRCTLTHSNTETGQVYALAVLTKNLIATGIGFTKGGGICIMGEDCQISHQVPLPKGANDYSINSLLWVEGNQVLWAGGTEGGIYIGRNLLTGSGKGKGKGGNTMRKLKVLVHGGFSVYALIESKTQEIFSAGGGIVGAWSQKGELLYQIKAKGENELTALCVSGDNKIILGDREGYIEIWEITPNEQLFVTRFQAHKEYIWEIIQIQMEGDDQIFITGSEDKSIKIINPMKGQIIKELYVDDKVKGITNISI